MSKELQRHEKYINFIKLQTKKINNFFRLRATFEVSRNFLQIDFFGT